MIRVPSTGPGTVAAGLPAGVEPPDRPRRVLVENVFDSEMPTLRDVKNGERKRSSWGRFAASPNHLVDERLLLLAELQRGEVAQALRGPEVGEVPEGVARLAIEAVVFAADHVIPGAEKMDLAAEHEAAGPQIPAAVLLAHLREAVRVLLESRVVADEAEAPVKREELRLDLDGVEPLVGDLGNDPALVLRPDLGLPGGEVGLGRLGEEGRRRGEEGGRGDAPCAHG